MPRAPLPPLGPRWTGRRLLPVYLTVLGILGGFLVGASLTGVPPLAGLSGRQDRGTMPSPLPGGRQLAGVNFNQFWEVWDYVKGNYVHENISDQRLFYGALEGILASLDDPYSVYLSPTTSVQFQQDLSGSFEGIGAEIGIRNERLTIIAPLPESPAERAGVKAGDVVLSIDGDSAINMPLDIAVSKIRGPKGKPVTLRLGRNGEKEPREISVVRDTIAIVSVSWQALEGRIAHLQLKYFNEDTLPRFRQAARQIVATRPKGIILDVRNNPGGFLATAIEVASFWTGPDQPVVLERQRGATPTPHRPKNRETLFEGIPTVVLINRGSASGSEIVAGALQDYAAATVVGETSFGKGSVQDFHELNDRSAIKLTIAKWLTPSGRELEGKGVTPDIEIKAAESGGSGPLDPQLDKAIELLRKK